MSASNHARLEGETASPRAVERGRGRARVERLDCHSEGVLALAEET